MGLYFAFKSERLLHELNLRRQGGERSEAIQRSEIGGQTERLGLPATRIASLRFASLAMTAV
jgi:hypothetical protein